MCVSGLFSLVWGFFFLVVLGAGSCYVIRLALNAPPFCLSFPSAGPWLCATPGLTFVLFCSLPSEFRQCGKCNTVGVIIPLLRVTR